MSRPFAAVGDLALAGLAARGDRLAFGELVQRAMPSVRSTLRRMGAQPAVADDVAQDAFIAAHRNIGGFRGDASFTTWVVQIAARAYLRRFRKESRYVESSAAAEPTACDSADSASVLHDLDRALSLLSSSERMCVTLCHGAGFTQSEIAAETGMPLGTVKSHVLRGLDKLRRAMEVEA